MTGLLGLLVLATLVLPTLAEAQRNAYVADLEIGPAAAGAASYTSKVTLSKERPYWHGSVLSTKFQGVRSCERDRVVKVFKRRDGKDKKIGKDLSSRSGRWVIPDSPTKGIYYARLSERRAGDKPGCDEDQSSIVVVD